jgi:RNA polymerase sigma-70 factor (ECF subfamily)
MAQEKDAAFPTTRWTLVARLRSGDEEIARRALEDLLLQYRYPLYVYIRRRGLAHHDAEDVLHDFLLRLMRAHALDDAEATQGRLRGLLGVALGRFLQNWLRDEVVRQRNVVEEIPAGTGTGDEERYKTERFSEEDTAERIFERQWGHALMARVMERLRVQCEKRGRGDVSAALRPALLAGGSLRGMDVDATAARLGMSAGNLRVALNRHLRDFRILLEEEVLQTVERPEDVADEIAHLMSAFRG